MKKFSILSAVLLILITTTILHSCKDDDDNVYYYNQSYAVGNMVVKDGEDPYLQLDSKRTMLPANTSIPSLFLKDGRRVIVNFSLLQENYMGYDYYIAINDIDTVLVKNIIPITPETADSIGNDPVNIINMWTSDEYLTIQFEMNGAGDKKHMVNVVRDFSLPDNPDKDKYMQLEFRHNIEGDRKIDRTLWGVASFRLQDLAPQVSDLAGLKIKVNTFKGEKTYNLKYEKEESTDKTSTLMQKSNTLIHIK
ncbi:NigD-like protein [Coprobacter sp.]